MSTSEKLFQAVYPGDTWLPEYVQSKALRKRQRAPIRAQRKRIRHREKVVRQ